MKNNETPPLAIVLAIPLAFLWSMTLSWVAALVGLDIWALFIQPEFGWHAPAWYTLVALSALFQALVPPHLPIGKFILHDRNGDELSIEDGRSVWLRWALRPAQLLLLWAFVHLLHWWVH